MKPTAILTPALVTALIFAGCVQLGGGCESSGPTDFKGQELTILDHGAFSFMHAAINETFTKKTGAKLTLMPGGDAGSALRMAIDSKGAPKADVIYGVDNALFQQGAQAGIFEPYASPNLQRIDSSVVKLDDFRYDGVILATPADHGFINVNYDARLSGTADEPKTLQDLARPQWASTFVVEDPRTASPGLGFLIATVATFGENDAYDYLDYWTDLFRNGVHVTDDWTTAYEIHFSAGYGKGSNPAYKGDRTVVVSYTTSPAAEVYFSRWGDNPYDEPPSVSLEPVNGIFHQIETVAILKCTKQLPLAKAFVDFVLSNDFQNQVSANMAVYPVVKGATTEEDYATFATAPQDLVPAPYSSYEINQNVDRWVRDWEKLYQAERA